MEQYTPKTWAMAAVKGIVSQKERESAQQELRDHILDHKEALLAAGFSREEAERQAIAAMGDPEETAKLLQKAHQPILTRLLQICRATAILLAGLLLLTALIRWDRDLPEYYDPVEPGEIGWYLQHDPLPDSVDYRRVLYPDAKGRLGSYGVEVEWVSISHMPGITEEKYPMWGGEWDVAVHVKFTRLPFSDRPVFRGVFTLDDGQQTSADYAWHDAWLDAEVPAALEWYVMAGVHLEGFSPTASRYTFQGKFAREPDKITFRYLGKDRTLELPIDLKGGTAYGQKP